MVSCFILNGESSLATIRNSLWKFPEIECWWFKIECRKSEEGHRGKFGFLDTLKLRILCLSCLIGSARRSPSFGLWRLCVIPEYVRQYCPWEHQIPHQMLEDYHQIGYDDGMISQEMGIFVSTACDNLKSHLKSTLYRAQTEYALWGLVPCRKARKSLFSRRGGFLGKRAKGGKRSEKFL
jgi:hypothetical protein